MNTHPILPAGPCRKILFCTDFSKNAEFAFQFAVDSAMRRPGCELYLLHIIPESDAQFWKGYIYEVDNVDNKAKNDLDERVNEAYVSRLPEGISLKVEYRIGKDWQEILDFAREKQVDLIVMGRQGSGALQKALFGNVTEKVARKAECAVLIVPLSFQMRVEKDEE
jgi:nucleotide-binding universal stress UspA family protein